MIDIIVLRQLYKRQEIDKIRCIYSKDNPFDGMTKILQNLILEVIITTNKTTIKRWVK